jgi:hypothetical protein
MRFGSSRPGRRTTRCRYQAQVCALFAALAACTLAPSARADDYRRPGLEGDWSERHLTVPMNSVNILVGPGQPMLFGQRFGDQIVDGGFQTIHPSSDWQTKPTGTQFWARGGVAFGLTQDWEAGALFVPFRITPDFDFSNITVFITRGFRFEHWDTAFRFSFQTPTKNSGGGRVWGMNPGIPFLWRVGRGLRLDGAVLVPFTTRDWTIGLNTPLRGTYNVTPHVFFGLQSGFVEPRFDVKGSATIPLGALAGYTALFGASVVDFTATFDWDRFVVLDPAPTANTLDIGSYRFCLGVVFHKLVR